MKKSYLDKIKRTLDNIYNQDGKLKIYEEWDINGRVRGRYNVFLDEKLILSKFIHIDKDKVIVYNNNNEEIEFIEDWKKDDVNVL